MRNLFTAHQNALYTCVTPTQVGFPVFFLIILHKLLFKDLLANWTKLIDWRKLKEAVARGFEIELERLNTDDSYFKSLPKLLESKRDYIAKFLTDVGMKPIIPEGGYFMIADWSSLGSYYCNNSTG